MDSDDSPQVPSCQAVLQIAAVGFSVRGSRLCAVWGCKLKELEVQAQQLPSRSPKCDPIPNQLEFRVGCQTFVYTVRQTKHALRPAEIAQVTGSHWRCLPAVGPRLSPRVQEASDWFGGP